MKTIHFQNIGRNKRSWSTSWLAMPDEETLVRDILRKGGLMSRDVGAVLHPDGTKGTVFAGFHTVGTFTVEDTK